ncbi:mechanosensitive ion channel [Stieleria sp. JC731]|uniref:mechanosensitive ion channel family protein n=1 Tax=Pirellulaceae TaxID=2691357 RepID=UPI001E4335DC|nr:mechanosensitive ion channel domain-containing protein [Stieleria sp. JC731]MCC9600889.1 mechanosensitive ion channel [Stieleria sp. JC731]
MLLAQAGEEAQTNAVGTPIDEWMDNVLPGASTWITPELVENVFYAVVGLIAIFCGYFVARYLSRIISSPICKRVDETLGRFVGNAIFYSTMIGLITFVASNLGFELGGLTAVLAATGFAIGLAFQGTLSNFASGVLMIVFRPFKVGDVVNIAGTTGKVNEIDLFTTTLDTPDNRRLIIPNSSISGSTIENISFHPHRRIEVLVGVDYKADIDATRQTLQEAVDLFASDTIHGESRGTKVVLANLGSSSVEWKVRMWVASGDFWKLQESLTGEIKRRLDRAGIGIPFPQMDVHLRRVDTAEAETTMRPRLRPVIRTSSHDGMPHAG